VGDQLGVQLPHVLVEEKALQRRGGGEHHHRQKREGVIPDGFLVLIEDRHEHSPRAGGGCEDMEEQTLRAFFRRDDDAPLPGDGPGEGAVVDEGLQFLLEESLPQEIAAIGLVKAGIRFVHQVERQCLETNEHVRPVFGFLQNCSEILQTARAGVEAGEGRGDAQGFEGGAPLLRVDGKAFLRRKGSRRFLSPSFLRRGGVGQVFLRNLLAKCGFAPLARLAGHSSTASEERKRSVISLI